MPTLKLPDGSVREAPAGARSRDVAEAIGKRLAKDAIAAKVDGQIVDLDRELPAGARSSFAVLTPKDPEALEVLRHSTAHIMARAVMRLFPGTQLAFGPPLENGFYYDIDSPTPITEADFPRIEEEMRKIVADAEPFERFERPTAEARELVRDLGQQYKVEHIDDDLKQYPTPELLPPGRVHRPVPRAAHSARRQGRRVQAAEHRRRLLEERQQPQAAPAPLRHRLLQPEGPRRLSAPDRGGEEARPPRPGQAAQAVHHQPGGRQRPDPVDAERGDRARHPGVVHQGRAAEARLPAGIHSAHRPAGTVPHQRPLPVLPRCPVPADVLQRHRRDLRAWPNIGLQRGSWRKRRSSGFGNGSTLPAMVLAATAELRPRLSGWRRWTSWSLNCWSACRAKSTNTPKQKHLQSVPPS